MMKGKFKLSALLAVIFATFIFSTAHAIPKVSLDACKGKSKGDVCNFTGPKGKAVDGVCAMPPKANGAMACVPKPVKEAFDVCQGKAEGDACSFTSRNGKARNGSCHKGPKGNMHCKPTRPGDSSKPAAMNK